VTEAKNDARPARRTPKLSCLPASPGRGWRDQLIAGRVFDIADLAQREKRSVGSTAMLLSLAFLGPALVQSIADDRLPRGIGLTRLSELPSDWFEQFDTLGLQAHDRPFKA
jgi:site-specific DNA recombinase